MLKLYKAALAGVIIISSATATSGLSAAHARGDDDSANASCAAKFTFEEHMILEWAALGGDPHAQLAIADCAYPAQSAFSNAAERQYALTWVTLAACDAVDTRANLARNVATRRLKEKGYVSFRRFGGDRDKERYNKREKMFQQYRERRTSDLLRRHKQLAKATDKDEKDAAARALADRLARMGPPGLLRLSTLSECKFFDTPKTFAAAAWSAASESWSDYRHAGAYGALSNGADVSAWLEAQSQDRAASLSEKARLTADYEKSKLLASTPENIERLEAEAALAALENLRTAYAAPPDEAIDAQEPAQFGVHAVEAGNEAGLGAGAGSLSAPASDEARARTAFETAHAGAGIRVTEAAAPTAVQYALEALGMIEFVAGGPDNDYGPATIEAVGRLQAAHGEAQTKWLSHAQVRRTICDAATTKADPVSLYNVALMYKNGWGFKRDLAKARLAISMAKGAMTNAYADKQGLSNWKRQHYPHYQNEIKDQSKEIDDAWAALPAPDRKTATPEEICVTGKLASATAADHAAAARRTLDGGGGTEQSRFADQQDARPTAVEFEADASAQSTDR